ncbi:MAG: DUF2491 family protein [Desulfomonilaceae bacterium]
MASTFDMLRQLGRKKYEDLKEAYKRVGAKRIDDNLPLGLRLNGMIEIDEVDFILGQPNLKVKRPENTEIILSYGRFLIGSSTVHRCYFSSADTPYMLQIVSDDRSGALEECKLFMAHDEIYPQDWDFWLSERDGYIGLSIFQLKDGTLYWRVWENDDAQMIVQQDAQGEPITHIPPVQFIETMYYDVYGDRSETLKHDAMLYGRHVNQDVDEYLLISAVNEKEGASVQIWLGLELSPAALKII